MLFSVFCVEAGPLFFCSLCWGHTVSHHPYSRNSSSRSGAESSNKERSGGVHCYRAVGCLIYREQVHTVCSVFTHFFHIFVSPIGRERYDLDGKTRTVSSPACRCNLRTLLQGRGGRNEELPIICTHLSVLTDCPSSQSRKVGFDVRVSALYPQLSGRQETALRGRRVSPQRSIKPGWNGVILCEMQQETDALRGK